MWLQPDSALATARRAGWRAGQQGQGPDSHAALEPGLSWGLVCTDTTEQLLAPCAAFWGEAGHLAVAGWKAVRPVCVSPVSLRRSPPAPGKGRPRLCSLPPARHLSRCFCFLCSRIKP